MTSLLCVVDESKSLGVCQFFIVHVEPMGHARWLLVSLDNDNPLRTFVKVLVSLCYS